QWLTDVDQYALLVAAFCHDLGHFGKTNPFLVETRHEMALRYNDKSPLENMHCAKLFDITSNAETDIFKLTSKENFKDARKTCIAAILHTDNVHHFDMIKELNKLYEMEESICEAQAPEVALTARYKSDVLVRNKLKWMELFLHLADVSNPLKPFEIGKQWAWRVLEEFFAQGDEEKELGLPIGMLNDRDK
ncbi:unnamed protein product, partial [Polarella glacialis]